ncbi:MAG: hypothetical protein ABWY06_16840 [Pseudomonas sp.]|uniref:hypothetical protein n=1 Tax=Pseudomonas sp. TaxID=306 RepID=UPI00339571FF
MTIISTTSDRDLTPLNSHLLQFSREMPQIPEESFLRYPNRWFLGSRDGCSCAFRHLGRGSTHLGFAGPEDWWPEEPDELEATLQIHAAFTSIVSTGQALDCIDAWTSDQLDPQLAGELRVNLAQMPASSFRLFADHRFELTHQD